MSQLVSLVTLAEEGANQVVAVVLTGTLHIAFIHIWNTVRRFTYMDIIQIILVYYNLEHIFVALAISQIIAALFSVTINTI